MSEPLPPGALGVFGGTFDPVHHGHLCLAEAAADQLGLVRVLWIPAGQPTHRMAPAAATAHRLAMVTAAIADNPRFVLDPGEARSPEPSYTVPTLERLRQKFGAQRPLVLLLGADAAAGIPAWHRSSDLLQLAHVAIAERPGHHASAARLPAGFPPPDTNPAALSSPAGGVFHFALAALDISATAIRTLRAAGRSTRYLQPDAVLAYMEQHHLYGPETCS